MSRSGWVDFLQISALPFYKSRLLNICPVGRKLFHLCNFFFVTFSLFSPSLTPSPSHPLLLNIFFFFKSSNQFAMFTLTCSSVHLHLAGLIFNPISMRSWELWESENSQGTKYHYVENGSRRQELVLLLHDFSDFWYGWRSQVRATILFSSLFLSFLLLASGAVGEFSF